MVDNPNISPNPATDPEKGNPGSESLNYNALPFSNWWPVFGGAAVGVAMRFIFSGQPGGPYAAMMSSFIFLVPILVGAVTVYLAERIKRRTYGYYIVVSILANLLFVIGTLLILLEGLICAIVIVPIFSMVGILGGLLMGLICRITNWPKHTLYGFALLPLIFGGIEGNVATPNRFGNVVRTVSIQAPPEEVWARIMSADDINPKEVDSAWIFKIGVPPPMSASLDPEQNNPVRKIRMGKNIYYDQIPTKWKENEFIHWKYQLYKDSFPAYALDDHVLVGGYYFDVLDTAYQLNPQDNGTELTISMKYRVTTQFNWYSEPLAQMLLGNFEETILEFYKQRSEL